MTLPKIFSRLRWREVAPVAIFAALVLLALLIAEWCLILGPLPLNSPLKGML